MSPKNILIVEDDPVVRDLCAVVLESHGFRSLVATNGREGVEMYGDRHYEISLVLSDILMPIMNGIEMTKQIFRVQPRAKVILMSAYSVTDILPAELSKLCAVIEKPFTTERLLEVVKKCLTSNEDHDRSSAATSN